MRTSNKFAEVLSVEENDEKMIEAIDFWRKYSDDTNNFIDIRNGFVHEVELMKYMKNII